MKIAAPKYTRDFYPEDMFQREWIESAWREASLAAGFLPWDGPILESLDLYERKSGPEIVEQLFNITTKGGQALAVRPEMTPTLARMIAARQASLPRPIKWYTIGRMCRYERGQRGRLREFWQWNVDLLGSDSPVADAEVISVALDGMERLKLSAQDVAVRINSRSLFIELLRGLGARAEDQPRILAVTDKRGKIPAEHLEKAYGDLGLEPAVLTGVLDLMNTTTLDDVRRIASQRDWNQALSEIDRLGELFSHLDSLGKSSYAVFDIGVVRGLAYYTGAVFEIFDRKGELRAVCGGGRYDHLMELMGGQPMSACGFGMGDVVLAELLAERGITPTKTSALDDFLIPLEDERMSDVLNLVRTLRSRGRRVDFAPKSGNLSKLLKRAHELGAKRAVLVGGREWTMGRIKVRDLESRQENEIPASEL